MTTTALDILSQSISVLKLRESFAPTLLRADIETIGQLVKLSPNELLQLPNLGKVCLRAIQTALAAHDLSLRPNRRRFRGPTSSTMRDLYRQTLTRLAACADVEPVEACVRSLNKGSLAWELKGRLPTDDERGAVRRWAHATMGRLLLLERVLNGSMTVVGVDRSRLQCVPFDWSTAPPDWMNPAPLSDPDNDPEESA
jgi:hypothetical protein